MASSRPDLVEVPRFEPAIDLKTLSTGAGFIPVKTVVMSIASKNACMCGMGRRGCSGTGRVGEEAVGQASIWHLNTR